MDCLEQLKDCLKYEELASRYHNTVPIIVYQESDVQEINQTCDIHNEKFTIYCKKYKCFCCSSCIVETHIECQKIAKLADILQNTKSSNAFYEIEHLLAELIDNIRRIRESRQINLRRLSEKKNQIEQEIKQTRNTINNHLDILQDDIIKKLQAAEEEESKQIGILLTLLTEKENEITEYHRKLEKKSPIFPRT
ncbi:unnamed protein product [Mytilus coruscus]|uniref:B box-type domain-containing protein n=1 Tax=Mytilus coruscus TaxID=42192 RepID=A0A6J8BXI0_MYTCO|nr:unnamed protein product [Mytilus coruscus]